MKRTLMLALMAAVMFTLGAASAQEDPFAGMGGGGGDSGLAVPDGSSSIRAKRKASPDMFEARVEKVVIKDENFPTVEAITIKITKAPSVKKGPAAQMKKGEEYQIGLYYEMKDGKFDWDNKTNRENVGAFFLEKGDKVEGQVKEFKDNKFILEFIQRKSK
ncbi:MAG: hypothetical protein C4523_11820 [Myxococcales bacterium]|nr:MAG: hypothetical protein C4523_11820 [Myxococcales bacterium]